MSKYISPTDASQGPSILGDFSAQAASYALSRPSYPPGLLKQLMRIAHVVPGDHVADLGAGTGILSQQLLAQGLHVDAVEPNKAMRDQAVPLPGIIWHEGTFNQIPLPDQSMKWIAIAQAFHWADPKTALPEMARVLAPGCSLSVLWNRRLNEQNPVTQWTINAIHKLVPDFDDLYRHSNFAGPLQSTGHFGNVTFLEEPHFIPMSRGRYLELWRSHNHLTVTAGPQKLKLFLDQLADYLEQEDIQTVDVPYSCQAWTAVRI